jgi:hypothetical protein
MIPVQGMVFNKALFIAFFSTILNLVTGTVPECCIVRVPLN